MKADKPTVRAGSALVKLALIIVVIGVPAVFAGSRFITLAERAKAAKAFNYLSFIQVAEEHYHARYGVYASSLAELKIQYPAPKHFSVGAIAPGRSGSIEDSWTLTLIRTGSSARYGIYTVTFTELGFDAKNSAITKNEDIRTAGIFCKHLW